MEPGYVDAGATRYDDPTTINIDDSDLNISFKNANHGSISTRQLGAANVVTGGRDTYENKGSSTFTWVADYKTTKITANKDGIITRTNEDDSQTSAVNTIYGGGFIYSPLYLNR